jgi:hypothetical protein
MPIVFAFPVGSLTFVAIIFRVNLTQVLSLQLAFVMMFRLPAVGLVTTFFILEIILRDLKFFY